MIPSTPWPLGKLVAGDRTLVIQSLVIQLPIVIMLVPLAAPDQVNTVACWPRTAVAANKLHRAMRRWRTRHLTFASCMVLLPVEKTVNRTAIMVGVCRDFMGFCRFRETVNPAHSSSASLP